MQPEELIPAGEFCAFHHVELSFIQNLHESGLIGMTVRDGVVFLPADDLPALEKFTRWFYELDINPEGIEALSHVLNRMERLTEENKVLRNRLRRFTNGGTAEPGEMV
ncbi:MAG TPA: chaperone modulator CbpM [Puia sp.]|jgi:hypothetical protein